MASATGVEAAGPDDEAAIVALLALAFGADPANRWLYPSPAQFLRHFPTFVQALGGRAFACGTAYTVAGARAAALWLPPHVHPDEDALVALVRDSVPNADQGAILAIFEQMGRYHPEEPHWYLPFIGVDPVHQRRGYGSALLRHHLSICDEEGTCAFLEASSVESIPLYRRHGFEVLGTIQEGSAPPIAPMLRRSRGSGRRRHPVAARTRRTDHPSPAKAGFLHERSPTIPAAPRPSSG